MNGSWWKFNIHVQINIPEQYLRENSNSSALSFGNLPSIPPANRRLFPTTTVWTHLTVAGFSLLEKSHACREDVPWLTG